MEGREGRREETSSSLGDSMTQDAVISHNRKITSLACVEERGE